MGRRQTFLLLLVLCVFASFVSAQSVSVELLDDWGDATGRVLEQGRVLLRVIDPAANTTPGRDSVAVDLSSVNGEDEATAHLTESGGGTGVFEGETFLTTDLILDNITGVDADQLYTTWTYPGPTLDTATASYGTATDSVEVGPSTTYLVDGDGRGTAFVTLGGRAHIQVRYPYADRSAGPEFTTVTVAASGGDSQEVTLTETGARTHIFEGSIPLEPGAPAAGDGRIQAAPFETLTVTHLDAMETTSSDTAQIVAASVSFVRARDGRATDVLLADSAIAMRVMDASRNLSPAAVDRLGVSISLEVEEDFEFRWLYETGPNTGVFEGSIQHTTGSYQSSGDDYLESAEVLPQLDTVKVQHEGTYYADAVAPLTGSILRLVDEEGEDARSFALGSDLRVELETARESGPYLDAKEVAVRSLTTGDLEMLRVVETDGRSFLFKGALRVVPGAAVPGDGRLQAVPGETVEVEHAGTNGVNGSSDQAAVTRSAVRFVNEDGLPASFLLEEDTVRVRVLDLLAGPVPPEATIRSKVGGDFEPLGLAELPASPGLFEGSIPTSLLTWGSGILTTGRNFYDPEWVIAGASQATASLLVVPAVLEILDSPVAVGGTLLIRATAPRADSSPSPETLVVIATSRETENFNYVFLAETGGATGIFEGSIQLALAGSQPTYPALEVAAADTIEAVYDAWEYVGDPTGRVVAVASVVPIEVELLDDQGEAAASYLIGDSIHVRVTEADANADPATVETLTATVDSRRYGDAKFDLETVTLTETGPDTGVFAGTLPTGVLAGFYDLPVPEDGLLQLPDYLPAPDNVSTVTATRSGVTARARVRDSELWLSADSFEVGAAVQVWMRRPLGNTTPGADTESVGVDVKVGNGYRDSMMLTLTETGGDTGLFTATVPSAPLPADFQDGILQAAPGDLLVVHRSNYVLYSFDTALFTGEGESEPLNREPDAVDDSASTIEDTPVVIDVDANDTDPDGDELEVYHVWPAANGTVVINADETVTYTPDAGFQGTDSFMYVIRDGPEGSPYLIDIATVTITVIPGNAPPVAVDDSAATAEDFSIVVPVKDNDSDPDADPFDVIAVTQGTNGSVTFDAGAGTVTYTPAPNFNGSDSFTYTIADAGGTDTGNVFVTVTPVNDPPVASEDTASTDENVAVVIPILANDIDVDGDPLTVNIWGVDGGQAVVNADKTLTFTPSPGYDGTAHIAYAIVDAVSFDAALVTITVSGENDPPIAGNDTGTTSEETSVVIDVRGDDSDPELQGLTVTAFTQGANGTVEATSFNENLRYTPAPNFFGVDTFTYTVSDPAGASSVGTVTVTVNGVNDPPVAVNDSATTDEDTAAVIAVLANDSDPDGDTLTVSAVTQGAKGSVATNGSTVTYTPAANANGSDSFTYSVRDPNLVTRTATVSITITPVNDPPVAAPDSGATREGVAVIVPVLANDTDVEGSALSVTAVGSPGVLLPNGTVSYTPGANFTGTATFGYTASDAQGGTASGQVTVTVGEALERVAILATNSVALRAGSDVLSGDVIVNQAGAGPFLNGAELSIAGSVTTAADWDVEADSLTVAAGSVVGGDVSYNQLTNGGTINGLQRSPLALPVWAALPAFLAATPGSTTINVATNGTRTLAPGSYLDLVVGRKGTVTFTGGTYHFRSITVDREAKLLFSAASQVRVQQKLSTKNLTTVGPAAGASIDASSIVFYVAGINGTTGALTATPKAVEIGTNNTVAINLYAPNGTIWLQDGSLVTGAFLGKDVDLGLNAQVTLDSAWQ